MEVLRSPSHGDPLTTHEIRMDIHLGTHIDAPSHFIHGGRTIDQMPLSNMAGLCRVIEFSDLLASEIPEHVMKGEWPERILFKTRNSALLSRPEFDKQFIALSEALARLLVRTGVCLVGIDYFSVDRFESSDKKIHHILLSSGVLILEGLDLSAIEPGDYQLIALPLNIIGAEGSPVRAVLVSPEQSL
jgi:arylformamidase